MSDVVPGAGVGPFESASELRAKHAELLEALDRLIGEDPSIGAEAAALSRLEPAIREFIERGAATGVYLQEIKERTACQVLLDYWISSLAQAALGAPPGRLATFDGDRLPDLNDKRCPYVGLDAFRDREFFFGRESDTRMLVDQVRSTPLVVVLGASGSGKSSLVMGGVLPALAELESRPALRIAPSIVPGTTVLQRLAEAVLAVSPGASGGATDVATKLASDPGSLATLAGGAAAAPVVVTIDQFEEVFTLTGDADREALTTAIATLLESNRQHRVILTMREEFRSRLVELRALGPLLDRAWYTMRPMGYEELKAAIERPAALVNLQFQSGIVDDLVKKVLGQPAALPLLQFTLRALWDRRDRNRITWEVYKRVGDPLSALKSSADAFYEALTNETQEEVRRILLELVRVDELLEAYRQPVPKSQLLRAGKANTQDVLRLLAQNDYVRVTTEPGNHDAIAEVKHESLIRNWPRLVGWIDAKRIEKRQRIALTQAAQRWTHSGRPKAGLLTGWQLEEAKRQPDLPQLEREFVEASAEQIQEREEELQRKLRKETRLTRAFRLATFAALMLAAVAFYFYSLAANDNRAARFALGQASMQDAVRLVATNQPAEALAHLARALRTDHDSPAARALTSDLLLNQRLWVPRTSLRHEQSVLAAAFSADGRRVVTASRDKTARVWDAATGEPTGAPLQHGDAVVAAAFSPDGTVVVTASTDTTARIWSADSGALLQTLEHSDRVNDVTFSPDGRLVVTASDDGTAQVWDRATGSAHGSPLRHEASVLKAAFSPNGTRVVTASADTTARIWDLTSARPASIVLHHEDVVTVAAFSPDGAQVVTGSADDTAQLWFAATGKPAAVFQHEGDVSAVAFSPTGVVIATGAFDGTIRLWDTLSGTPVSAPLYQDAVGAVTAGGRFEPVTAIVFSRDGGRIATTSISGTARVWNADTGQPVGEPLGHDDAVNAAAFSPDGRRLVTASSDNTARIWDIAAEPATAAAIPYNAATKAATFRANGARLVVSNPSARLLDAITGRVVAQLPHTGTVSAATFSPDGLPHTGTVSVATFSPDGRRVVTASTDGTARVWDAGTGVPVSPPLQHKLAVTAAAFSPDGRRVITTESNTARVWDAATGQQMGPPLLHPGVRVSAFSADGERVVTASGDNTRVWEVTGQPIGTPNQHKGAIKAIDFARNAPRAVIVSDLVRIWDSAIPLEGVPLQNLDYARDAVEAAAFSPDGRLLVTASRERARLWDTATGQPVGGPLEHEGAVNAIAFSSDGHHLVIGFDDSTSRMWQILLDLDSDESVERLADVAEIVSGSRVTEQSSVVRLMESERLQRVERVVGPGHATFVPFEVLIRPFLYTGRLRPN